MSESTPRTPPSQDPEPWPEIVFPEPHDENRFIVTVDGAILTIGREHVELPD